MTRNEAIKIDTIDNKVEVYVDEEDGIKYIFGLNSGFAYASPCDISEWIKANQKFNLYV